MGALFSAFTSNTKVVEQQQPVDRNALFDPVNLAPISIKKLPCKWCGKEECTDPNGSCLKN